METMSLTLSNKTAICGAIEKPFVDFETEYQLDQFRQIEKENFDEYNKHYKGVYLSHYTAEQMLKLINQMELELKKHARFTNY